MIKGLKTSSNWSLFRPEHPWFTVDEFFMTILFNFLFLCFQSLSEESKFEFLQLGNTSATSLYIFQTEFYVCQDKYQISCETSGSFMFIFQDWILIKNTFFRKCSVYRRKSWIKKHKERCKWIGEVSFGL